MKTTVHGYATKLTRRAKPARYQNHLRTYEWNAAMDAFHQKWLSKDGFVLLNVGSSWSSPKTLASIPKLYKNFGTARLYGMPPRAFLFYTREIVEIEVTIDVEIKELIKFPIDDKDLVA